MHVRKLAWMASLHVLVMMWAASALAAWSSNAMVNTRVSRTAGLQYEVSTAPDGSGGMYVVWRDERSSPGRIYAQHLDSNGNPLWNTNGVPVCSFTSEQYKPIVFRSITTIVVWQDDRAGNLDIFAQRLDDSGQHQAIWPATGAPVCTAAGTQQPRGVVSDGNGGVIVSWLDQRSGTRNDLYAQRVDVNGSIHWGEATQLIATGLQWEAVSVGDDHLGAIFAWEQNTVWGMDIRAQRVNNSGTKLWASKGIPVCVATNHQEWPAICKNGAGGAFFAWSDMRIAGGFNIYAQSVNSDGVVQWAPGGVSAIAVGSWNEQDVQIVPCGSGIILACESVASGYDSDIIAQRLNSSGTRRWGPMGTNITPWAGFQLEPQLVSDGQSGAVIAWDDDRFTNSLYAQRLTSDGAKVWNAGGVLVSKSNSVSGAIGLVTNTSGGTILGWAGWRSGASSSKVFAQRLNANGSLGGGSGLWADATDVGGGWKHLAWFGYFNDAGSGWIFHNEHGWMYASGTTTASIWFWTTDMGWLWTSSTVYPYLYRHSDTAWLWYLVDSSSPRWFYNFNTSAWESRP